MPEGRRTVLTVATADEGGGANLDARRLHEAYGRHGYDAWMAVGRKRSDDPRILTLPNQPQGGWEALKRGMARRVERRLGVEDFRHPGIWRLPDRLGAFPDLVHCHNLHGGYFDLRALPWLGERAEVVLTLHDAWLLSGHCAHSFDCERWLTGCGDCPDLTIYPAVERDATAYNWRRKRRIHAAGRYRVCTPCRWLMDKVERSILAEGMLEGRVIPYGVDLETFRPRPVGETRRELGLPAEARILLFAAAGIRDKVWRDFRMMREVVARVAAELGGSRVLFVALGESGPPERIGDAEVVFVPYQDDRSVVAAYYAAADLYLHAARADTFPNAVLEALACGTPVAGTAVGGIPEQVRGHAAARGPDPARGNGHGPDRGTGLLVEPGDAEAMARGIVELLERPERLAALGRNAVADARERFDERRQVAEYLEWFEEVFGDPATAVRAPRVAAGTTGRGA